MTSANDQPPSRGKETITNRIHGTEHLRSYPTKERARESMYICCMCARACMHDKENIHMSCMYFCGLLCARACVCHCEYEKRDVCMHMYMNKMKKESERRVRLTNESENER